MIVVEKKKTTKPISNVNSPVKLSPKNQPKPQPKPQPLQQQNSSKKSFKSSPGKADGSSSKKPKMAAAVIGESEEYSVPSETVRTSHNPNLTFKSIQKPFKK
jgi:hypothetical protein